MAKRKPARKSGGRWLGSIVAIAIVGGLGFAAVKMPIGGATMFQRAERIVSPPAPTTTEHLTKADRARLERLLP